MKPGVEHVEALDDDGPEYGVCDCCERMEDDCICDTPMTLAEMRTLTHIKDTTDAG